VEVLNIGELKTNFSEVLKKVLEGNEVGIAYGKQKKIVAKIVPNVSQKRKRKIGLLDGKGKVKFSRNYKITEEAFLGL